MAWENDFDIFNNRIEFPDPKFAYQMSAYWNPQKNLKSKSSSSSLGKNVIDFYEDIYGKQIAQKKWGNKYQNQHVIPQNLVNKLHSKFFTGIQFSTDNALNCIFCPTTNYVLTNKKYTIIQSKMSSVPDIFVYGQGTKFPTGVSVHTGYHGDYSKFVSDCIASLSKSSILFAQANLGTARLVSGLRILHTWGMPIYPTHNSGNAILVGEQSQNYLQIIKKASKGGNYFRDMWKNALNIAFRWLEQNDPYLSKPRINKYPTIS